jgi:hypothetical protein
MTEVRIVRRAIAAIIAIAMLYLVAWTFGRGGIHYFSPFTLETQASSELLIPLTEIPIFRSRPHTYRYELVHYLIDEGYWEPTKADNGTVITNRWNLQWRDGHSDFHRQFSRGAHTWVEWSRRNPALAEELWPAVLRLLRTGTQSRLSCASYLMWYAQRSDNVEEYRQLVANDVDLQAVIDRSTR